MRALQLQTKLLSYQNPFALIGRTYISHPHIHINGMVYLIFYIWKWHDSNHIFFEIFIFYENFCANQRQNEKKICVLPTVGTDSLFPLHYDRFFLLLKNLQFIYFSNASGNLRNTKCNYKINRKQMHVLLYVILEINISKYGKNRKNELMKIINMQVYCM